MVADHYYCLAAHDPPPATAQRTRAKRGPLHEGRIEAVTARDTLLANFSSLKPGFGAWDRGLGHRDQGF
jgi:hypothetical protein